jgi:hypothetical protein
MTWEKKAKELRELLNKDCKVLDSYISDEKDNLHTLFDKRKDLYHANWENKNHIQESLEDIKAVNDELPLKSGPLTEQNIRDLSIEMKFLRIPNFAKMKQFAEHRLGDISLAEDEFELLLKASNIQAHREQQGKIKKLLERNDKEIEEKIEFIAHSKLVSELQECERKED